MLNKQRSKKLIGNDYVIPIRDGKKTKTVSEKPGIPRASSWCNRTLKFIPNNAV